jgi:hypothetical protein
MNLLSKLLLFQNPTLLKLIPEHNFNDKFLESLFTTYFFQPLSEDIPDLFKFGLDFTVLSFIQTILDDRDSSFGSAKALVGVYGRA